MLCSIAFDCFGCRGIILRSVLIQFSMTMSRNFILFKHFEKTQWGWSCSVGSFSHYKVLRHKDSLVSKLCTIYRHWFIHLIPPIETTTSHQVIHSLAARDLCYSYFQVVVLSNCALTLHHAVQLNVYRLVITGHRSWLNEFIVLYYNIIVE